MKRLFGRNELEDLSTRADIVSKLLTQCTLNNMQEEHVKITEQFCLLANDKISIDEFIKTIESYDIELPEKINWLIKKRQNELEKF